MNYLHKYFRLFQLLNKNTKFVKLILPDKFSLIYFKEAPIPFYFSRPGLEVEGEGRQKTKKGFVKQTALNPQGVGEASASGKEGAELKIYPKVKG
jgi:hypothetical protein